MRQLLTIDQRRAMNKSMRHLCRMYGSQISAAKAVAVTDRTMRNYVRHQEPPYAVVIALIHEIKKLRGNDLSRTLRSRLDAIEEYASQCYRSLDKQ